MMLLAPVFLKGCVSGCTRCRLSACLDAQGVVVLSAPSLWMVVETHHQYYILVYSLSLQAILLLLVHLFKQLSHIQLAQDHEAMLLVCVVCCLF